MREWYFVRTPRELAEFFLDGGETVGRKYENARDVFQSQGSKEHVVGLLELLVKNAREKNSTWADDHAEWLRNWQDDLERLMCLREKEISRVIKLLNGYNKSRDFHTHLNIHWFSRCYRRDPKMHRDRYDELKAQVERLRSVKKPADAINLDGVGKKTLAKILSMCEAKE